jgi:hypothetical protein
VEYPPVSQRTRILFALVGILTCLAAALCGELALGRMKAAAGLRNAHVASLLFLTTPETTQRAVPVEPPPQAPDEAEVQRRLDQAGAQTGDVQISLTWNNNNDLDLSCMEPSGEMLDGYNQQTRSGGVMDVDMNPTDESLMTDEARMKLNARESRARAHRTSYSSEPVENLVWTHNPPAGHYKVYVHQFCNKERVAQTPFWVVVRVRGKLHRITGEVGREDFAENLAEPKLVYQFDVPREDEKPVPAPVVKITPAPVVPPPPPRIVTEHAYTLKGLGFALLTAGFWGALIGLLPVALLAAQRVYLRLPPFYGAHDLIVVLGGPATGFAAAATGQLLLALVAALFPIGALPALFVLSWTVLACAFGAVLSLYTPNLPRIAAPIAGALAAFAGSTIFLLLAVGGLDSTGRLLTASLLGGAIGALIALPAREPEPEVEPVPPTPRPAYEVQPPFIVRGTRTRKVGGLSRTDRPADR